MVGIPGLEPGNPEGADLQSAAVAAVPYPHSRFQAARLGVPLQAGEILRLDKPIVNVIHAAGRIFPTNPAQSEVDATFLLLPKAESASWP